MNTMARNSLELEASLKRLSLRMPNVPVCSVLLSRLIIHLGQRMATNLEQQTRQFGLSEAELRVLTVLFSQPDGVGYPSELCAGASQSAANISRISDSLVSRSLITRAASMEDRRKIVLRITEAGEKIVRERLPAFFGSFHEMFRDFSKDDQRQLIVQLKLLGSRLNDVATQEGAERPL